MSEEVEKEKKSGLVPYLQSYVGKFGGRKFAAFLMAIIIVMNLEQFEFDVWLMRAVAIGTLSLAGVYMIMTGLEDIFSSKKNGGSDEK